MQGAGPGMERGFPACDWAGRLSVSGKGRGDANAAPGWNVRHAVEV